MIGGPVMRVRRAAVAGLATCVLVLPTLAGCTSSDAPNASASKCAIPPAGYSDHTYTPTPQTNEAQATFEKLKADVGSGVLQRQGIAVGNFGIDDEGNRVEVNVFDSVCPRGDLLPAAVVSRYQALFDAEYGKNKVIVRALNQLQIDQQ